MDSDLSYRAKYTGLAIAVYMSNQGITFVSLDTLSKKTGQSKHTVKKFVDLLESAGWLERHSKGNGHKMITAATIPQPVHPDSTGLPVHFEVGTGALLAQTGAPRVHPNSVTPVELQGDVCKHTTRARTGPNGTWSICADCGHTIIEENGTDACQVCGFRMDPVLSGTAHPNCLPDPLGAPDPAFAGLRAVLGLEKVSE